MACSRCPAGSCTEGHYNARTEGHPRQGRRDEIPRGPPINRDRFSPDRAHYLRWMRMVIPHCGEANICKSSDESLPIASRATAQGDSLSDRSRSGLFLLLGHFKSSPQIKEVGMVDVYVICRASPRRWINVAPALHSLSPRRESALQNRRRRGFGTVCILLEKTAD
jgi:hypothetical protein